MDSNQRGNYSGYFSPQHTSSPAQGRFPSPFQFQHYSPRPNNFENRSPAYSGGQIREFFDHSPNFPPLGSTTSFAICPTLPAYQRNRSFNPQWSSSPNYSPQRHFSPRSNSGGSYRGHQRGYHRNRNQFDTSFNVHKYIDPSMLVDPWLELEQQRIQPKEPETSVNKEIGP